MVFKMEEWLQYYTKREQKAIRAKIEKGIDFPDELYRMARQKQHSFANLKRMEFSRKEGLPLLNSDIQILTEIINGSTKSKGRSEAKTKEKSRVSPSRNRRPGNENEVARERLRTLLRRYDGMVSSGEEIGEMQFEKHRRYRHKAAQVLENPQATTNSLKKQVNYLENQIERLEERVSRRQERWL